MSWKVKENLAAPTDFVLTDSILSWSHPSAERFTIYAFPRETNEGDAIGNPMYFKRVVYGNSFNLIGLGDISQLTIAVCSYDRYGMEHEYATFQGEGYFDYPQVIFWELYGGTVDVELPKYVTETYILPTARKEGHTFGGWYKTKTFRGSPLTELVDGWAGTLHAKWTALPSALSDAEANKKTRVYDIMGNFVGNAIPDNKKGVFIVVQGEEQYKIVR